MLSVDIALRTSDFTLSVKFDVSAGVTVLFGPSGSGKTRTLGCIAGIVTPDSGRIALGDTLWFDGVDRVQVHERGVAYVFQSLALFPHMTAAENVAYGIRSADKSKEARSWLERMHVPHLADRRPRTFSGGEAQRVALARALATKPRIVLLDEPFSALDRKVKAKLLAETRDLIAREKLPAIMVTHDAEEARAIGDRVIFLEQGTITSTAPVESARFSSSLLEAAPDASSAD